MNFTELMINKQSFYNFDNLLFHFVDQRLQFYGFYDQHNEKFNMSVITPNRFQHNLSDIDITKKTIIYYTADEFIHYNSKLLCENIARKNFNVIIISPNSWNITINGVYYFNLNSQNNHEIINKLSKVVQCIYIENCTFFLHFAKEYFENATITLLYHHNTNFTQFNDKILPYNGTILFKNMLNNIDKICFYSSDNLNEFKKTIQNPSIIEKKLIQLNYIISSIKSIEKKENDDDNDNDDITKIISYDKYYAKAIKFAEKISKKYKNKKIQLILFDNNPQKTTINHQKIDIKLIPRYCRNLFKQFTNSKIFFTNENEKYTHFNIIIALKCNMKCFIPDYFQQFKNNKRVSYNRIVTPLKNLSNYITESNEFEE